MPAAGSSSSRIRGLVASASAISTSRCLPYGRFARQRVGLDGRAAAIAAAPAPRPPPRAASPRCGARRPARPSALADRRARRLEHREAREQRVDLERARHAALHALVLRKRGDPLVAQEHVARGRRERAGQQVDERRLAGAVRPDQRVPRAVRKGERDVAVRAECAELLREPRRAQRGRHVLAHAARSRSASAAPRMPSAREEHDDDQQQAEPELPVDGIQIGQVSGARP